jgi:hypothetical protein
VDDDETDVVTIGFVAGPADACSDAAEPSTPTTIRSGCPRLAAPRTTPDRARAGVDDAPGRVPECDRGHSIVAGGADDEQIIGTEATQEHSGGRMGG